MHPACIAPVLSPSLTYLQVGIYLLLRCLFTIAPPCHCCPSRLICSPPSAVAAFSEPVEPPKTKAISCIRRQAAKSDKMISAVTPLTSACAYTTDFAKFIQPLSSSQLRLFTSVTTWRQESSRLVLPQIRPLVRQRESAVSWLDNDAYKSEMEAEIRARPRPSCVCIISPWCCITHHRSPHQREVFFFFYTKCSVCMPMPST